VLPGIYFRRSKPDLRKNSTEYTDGVLRKGKRKERRRRNTQVNKRKEDKKKERKEWKKENKKERKGARKTGGHKNERRYRS
jgi:hypothetical protein